MMGYSIITWAMPIFFKVKNLELCGFHKIILWSEFVL